MKENFDNKFSQKVREVFENRQEPYNPADWEKLKAKKSKRKDRLFFWYFNRSVAVAILFLVLGGTGGLILYKTFQKTTTPVNDKKEIVIEKKEPNNRSNINDPDSIDKQDSLIKPIYNDIESIINENKNNITKTNENDQLINNKDGNSNRKNLNNGINKLIERKKVNESTTIVSVEKKGSNKPDQLLTEQIKLSDIKKDSADVLINKSKIASVDLNSTETIEELQNVDLSKIDHKKVVTNLTKSVPHDSLSKKDINSVLENRNEKRIKNNAVTFGLAVSPIVNYDQTTQNTNVSFGGGVLVEIPIFKNVDIYTGLLVTNQKINFQENALQTVASGTQLKSKDAALTGLDVPINLKYNFSLNKTKMFITTGLSSTTYFKENIKSTFQVSSTIFTQGTDELGNPILVSNIVNTTETQTESKGSFNDFNFGKIINLSFGVELPLKNNRQSIIIEPYFKYPLGSLTTENINFSSGGVNLKLNFNRRR